LTRYFLETSALVKLYVREKGSEELIRLGQSDTSFTVLATARVEMMAALHHRLRRKDIPAEAVRTIAANVEEHWRSFFLVQPVTDAILGGAINLIERHSLPAAGALHLSACISTVAIASGSAVVFVSCDKLLLAAAQQEELAILNPGAAFRPTRSR
jgi:predicted nucleic acid-binding protein